VEIKEIQIDSTLRRHYLKSQSKRRTVGINHNSQHSKILDLDPKASIEPGINFK
jgi:hypothetical protein